MNKKIIQYTLSRRIFQNFFENVLNIILKILNIGEGQSVETSGEKNTLNVLKKINKNKKVVVFDVGAHTGEWYKMFKKEYTEKAFVHSFEPSKMSFNTLSKIKDEDFHPENIALGNISEMRYLSGQENGCSGSFLTSQKDPMSELVRVETLDKYCKSNNIDNIDLLKIDIEGYELKMLDGAKDMISENRISLIQFEFGAPSEEKYSLKDFFDLLNSKYQICRILNSGIFPLKTYKHYYEINTITNFIAIRRDLLIKIYYLETK